MGAVTVSDEREGWSLIIRHPQAVAHSQSDAAAPAESVGDRNDRNSKRQNISIMKRSKPSGATGRKRKKEQEESKVKDRGTSACVKQKKSVCTVPLDI